MKKLSPFKYFNPFYTSDKDEFFGRKQETLQLHNLTKQSYLTVLSGLSGSGKTSLINAGLIPKMGIGKNAIISVHKKKDEKLTESLLEILRNDWGLDTSSIQQYLEEQLKLGSLLKKKEELSDDLNLLEEDIDKYEYLSEAEQKSIALQDQKEEFDTKSAAHKDALQQIAAIKEHRTRQIDEIRNVFKSAIKHKFYGKSPLIIFDQFEEIFFFEVKEGEEDEKSEVKEFGIFLELMIKNNIPINCILALRQEQFGYLDRLHDYLPKIFEKNIRITRPSRRTVFEIITKSFDKFNIQCTDELKHQIIENIKPDASKEVFHLPFLQVYLHELYLQVLAREKKVYDPENLPEVEVKAEDFNELSNIRDLIMGIIADCDDELLQNKKIKKSKTLRNNKFLATTVLKLFVSDHKTKIRFHFDDIETLKSASGDKTQILANQYFSHDFFGVDKGAIHRLWKAGESEMNKKKLVSKIISLLLSKNLLYLNHEEKYIELAHDTLAELIHYIPVEEDILAHYKRNFDSAFLLYTKDLREEVKNPSLLSEDLVNRIGQDIEYIIQDDKSNYDQKKDFWKKSNDFYTRRKRRREKWAIGLILTFFSIACIAGWQWYEADQAKLSEGKAKEEASDLGDVFKNAGTAYNAGKSDLTEAYNIIKGLEDEKKQDSTFFARINKLFKNDGPPNLRNIYKGELINNFYKRPYYYMNIPLDKSDHVLATKSRKYSVSGDTILLYAHTQNDLHILNVDLNSRKVYKSSHLEEVVTAFEPYTKDGQYRMIYSSNYGLLDVNETLSDTLSYKGSNVSNLREIEKLSADKFVAITEDGKSLLWIDRESRDVSYLPLHSRFKANFADKSLAPYIREIYKIKKIKDGVLLFIAKAGINKWLFKWDLSKGIENSQLYSAQLSIVNFEDFQSLIVANEKMYIADKRAVYELDLKDINQPADLSQSIFPYFPKIVSRHNEEVTSIDYSDEYFLIGSVDRTASLTFDPSKKRPYDDIKLKEFIGHTDAIMNVSFLNNSNKNKKYILTSGKDGTIKIWDITEIELNQILVPNVNEITQLKTKNSKVFASFDLMTDNNGRLDYRRSTFILEANDTLGPENKYYYRGNTQLSEKHLQTFDFDAEEIVTATKSGVIRNAQVQGSPDQSIIINPNSTINDIVIRGNQMAFAQDTGITVIVNFRETKKSSLSKNIERFNIVSSSRIHAVDIHPNESLVLAAADNGDIYLWEYRIDSLETLRFHNEAVKDVCFSETGKYILSGSNDNLAKVWRENENYVKARQKPKSKSHNRLGKNKSEQKELRYIDLADKNGGLIKVHNSDIEDVDFRGDNLIATASSDNTVKLHEIEEGKLKQLPSLIYHNFSVRAVAFGDEDGIIYSGDKKGVIKKWNWKNFEEEIENRRKKSDDPEIHDH